MTDPISRIISIIFRAQGKMTMDDLCSPGSEQRVYEACHEQLDKEVEDWFMAKWKLRELENE